MIMKYVSGPLVILYGSYDPIYCHARQQAPVHMVRHLNIFGQVQGVGFRYHFSQQAQRLRIAGWVRNRRGGSVEAMIEGTPEAVEALLAWARLGPPSARVERVEVGEAEGVFAGFELRPTE
jgi:acylphosphatase